MKSTKKRSYFQTSTSVQLTKLVTKMQHAQTPMAATLAHVNKVTLEMENNVKIIMNVKGIHAVHWQTAQIHLVLIIVVLVPKGTLETVIHVQVYCTKRIEMTMIFICQNRLIHLYDQINPGMLFHHITCSLYHFTFSRRIKMLPSATKLEIGFICNLGHLTHFHLPCFIFPVFLYEKIFRKKLY